MYNNIPISERHRPFSGISSHSGLMPWLVVLIGLLGGCWQTDDPDSDRPASGQSANTEGGRKMTLEVTSSAFGSGQPIPKKYTGEGRDISPPLSWSACRPMPRSWC